MISSIGIRLIIIAVLAASCFGGGFMLGVKWEDGVRDREELARVKDVIIKTRTVIQEREKIVTKYVNRIVRIHDVRDRVTAEVQQHAATIPDPRECWLAPERVRNINDAIAGDGAAPGERVNAPAVPAAAGAPVGEPSSGGGLGSRIGAALQGMRRASGDAGADPEITK